MWDRIWKYPEDLITTAMIADDAVTFAKIQDITTDRLLGRDSAATGIIEEIRAGGGMEFTGGLQFGIAANGVANTMLRDSAALSVIGRSANSSGDPADITTTAASAAVLRESGSTVGFGTVATAGIANDAVTFAKMQNIATATLVGRTMAGTGDPESITPELDLTITVHFDYRPISGSNAISPPTMASGDPTISSGNDADGHVAVVLALDAVFTWVHFQWTVPDEMDLAQAVSCKVGYITNGAPAAGNAVDLDIIGGIGADNEATTAPGTAFSVGAAKTITAYGAGDWVVHDIGNVITAGLGADRIIRGVVQRDATVANGSDTYADLIGLAWIKFVGKRKLAA